MGWEGRRRRVLRKRVGKREGVVENGAPALVGPASDARGQLGRDQKASAKGAGKAQWRAARG
eukprot:scaffold120536_cov21-Phaeocystis_antarctica.AAC.1